MPLSLSALDEFVSQEMSLLTSADPRPVANSFPQLEHWIATFLLNTIFGHPIGNKQKRFCLVFLRRVEGSISEYERFHTVLADYLSRAPRSPSLYFRCLHHLEISIFLAYQAFDFARKVVGMQLFQPNDGSRYQRLNYIYNTIRHFDPATLPADHLHAIWLSNAGVHVSPVQLSFAEFADLLVELGELAEKISRCERPAPLEA